MLFNSIQFFIFFPVVTLLFFLLPHRFRWGLLLLASCWFYMAFIPVYVLILFLTIIVDYWAGIWIEDSVGSRRKLYLWVSLVCTVAILFVFKYFNFFNDNVAALARFIHWNYSFEGLKIILPIGLSFHTFQSMSYVIEVYRGNQKAERHFGIYSLYVMFYPQLVAGPIERPQNLLHQFHEEKFFDYKRVTDGLKLMAWGLFKKVVVADRLAVFVNNVYGHPTEYQGVQLILATVFFAFQIYCDFSGYSDIAIGSAQVMGFKLMQNFNRPYYAKSISEFWKRWHISLSTWFKDYVYIPLGGNRVERGRLYFNLFLTFLISGLWHGANWTYVVWGALNGVYLILEMATQDWRRSFSRAVGLDRRPLLLKWVQVSVTFSLVFFSWIFFRAATIHDALYIVRHLFTGIPDFVSGYVHHLIAVNFDAGLKRDDVFRHVLALGRGMDELKIALLGVLALELIQSLQRKGSVRALLSFRPPWFRWTAYYLLVMGIILFGFGEGGDFIYFQF